MSEASLGFQGFSGRLGQWSFNQRQGRTFVRQRPTKRGEPSASQREVQRRFYVAAKHAKAIADDPVARLPYEAVALARKTTVYQVAMGDTLRAPVVESIVLDDLQGWSGIRSGSSRSTTWR